MCGIAGAVDLTGSREFSARRLLAMTAAIAHRGPDDEQIHIEPGVALGARRLSIIDLAGGRQPIANEDGSIWVAFNGELFEYPELRQELLARGHRLATRCDTEAWVHLYEDLREGMFAKARGQFAVSLWDRTSRTLILGRDRVGICPLYYAEADGWLLWGSEVKALLASGLVAAQPDVRGIDHLFTFFCAGTTRTFFEGIKSLPPGHFLKVRDGRVTKHQYWDLDFPDAGQERRLGRPRARWSTSSRRLLQQAVERRLRSDVPVVSYISGGLDSTVVLGLCSRHRGEPIPSFTIGFDGAGPDERAHSTEAAAVLGSPLTTVTMDKSKIAATFPELVRAAEGPVLDTSCAALLRLAQAVHEQGYKVALTGEGADEALAGYVWYKTQKVRDGVYRDRGPVRSAPAAQPGRALGGRPPHGHPPRAGHRRRPPRPAGHVRDDLPVQADPLLRGDVAAARRSQPLLRPRHHHRPDPPLAPAEPVALRRLQGDARRPADDLQGRPDRDERLGRDALSVPRRRRDRLLRGDRPGVQAARHDREVDPPPGRRGSCPSRSPTAPRRCSAPACRRRSSARTVPPGSISS